MFDTRAGRTWRGIAAAGTATFAAAVSHSVADERPAPLLGVILALVFAVPVCVALAGKRLSWVRLGLAVALSQFVFHGLLLIGVGADGGSAAGPVGHAHGADLVVATSTTTAPVLAHSGAGMWIAHAVAAAITVLAIGHGERMLRGLLSLPLFAVLFAGIDWRPATPVRRRLPAPAVRLLAETSVAISCVVRRRGPPLAA